MSSYLPVVSAVIFPHVGGILGGLITIKQIPTWYENIKKPSWRPSNKVFGPVWTTLYTGMGYASYLVWRDGGGFHGDAKIPLAIYGTSLALNWMWTPIFFYFHKLGMALAEITLLSGTVAGCIYAFYPINKTASYLMMPYLAWLGLATSLTYCIWRDNKKIE